MLATARSSEAKFPTFDMIGSMGTVIERHDVPSVFGHAVAMNNTDGGFEFRNYTVTLEEKSSFSVPKGTNPIEVLSKIAEAQQYSFSCFVSSPGDAQQAVAFHYLRGKFAYIYYGDVGQALSKFVLYKNMNAIEIGERAKAELGVNWRGSISSRAGVPLDYGIPAEKWTGLR
jgi:hypothetical protein